VWDEDRPRVVDVNPFPSCRRVPDAAAMISDHLIARLTLPDRA
jgi:hypothetical protein